MTLNGTSVLKDEIFGHKIKVVSQSQEEQENADDLLLLLLVSH